MIELYRRSFGLFFGYFPFFAFIAALFLAIEHFGFGDNAGASFFVYTLIALYCHKLLLAKEPVSNKWIWRGSVGAKDETNPLAGGTWPFFWRSGVFMIFLVAIMLLITFGSASLFDGLAADISGLVVLFSVIGTVTTLGVALALIGTVFPAAAIGGDAALDRAFKRGRKTFWITLLRFVVGPGLVTFATLGVVLLFPAQTDGLVPNVMFELIGMFSTCLSATALCLAYEKAELQLASTTSD